MEIIINYKNVDLNSKFKKRGISLRFQKNKENIKII